MLNKAVIEALKKIVSENNLLLTPEDLAAYSYDATSSWQKCPDGVVFPQNKDQVSRILKLASGNRIPVTARDG